MSKQELIEEAAAHCQACAYWWTQADMDGTVIASDDIVALVSAAHTTARFSAGLDVVRRLLGAP